MSNNKFIIILILTAATCRLLAQSGIKELTEADDLFAKEAYSSAVPRYLDLLKNDSLNILLNYKIGVCYLNSRSQKLKAIEYLVKGGGTGSPAMTHKFLGDAYQIANKYELALKCYEKFKKLYVKSQPKDQSIIEEVNWKIDMCKIGKALQAIDTGKVILNPENIHYSSSFSRDQSTMTYTFQRADVKNKTSEDSRYFEEIHIPKTGAARFNNIIDTATNINEATVASSVDGQIVLTYRNDKGQANLYITRLIGNQWTPPEKINKSINLTGWEPNEFISADGHTLYFASDRPGGFGKNDIYVCKKLSTGEWGKASNLGPAINTPYDDEAPFIYSNGRTLFFSSNKHKQSCCFDVFTSTLSNEGTWTEPIKVGYPIKTNADSPLYAATTAAATKAALYEGKDLYRATFIDQNKTPFTILKGKVIDASGKLSRSVKITVTDNETGEISGVYTAHYKTGDYVIILPPGRNNNITYESNNCLFQSENIDMIKKNTDYEIYKAIQISPLTTGSKIVLNNIFFDFDRSSLRPVSNVELKNLFDLLSKESDIVIELSYMINLKENNKYNEKLSLQRAQEVANYLTGKGIHKERVLVKEFKYIKPKGKPEKKYTTEESLSDRLELKIIDIK